MRVCCHCQATSSPCWRRGPQDAPLLCNACGAHYLAKRSLANYYPKGYRLRHDASGDATHSQKTTAGAGSAGDLKWGKEDGSGASGLGRYQQLQPQPDQTKIECSKRPRLVCCRVYEVDVQNSSAYRMLKTFETADGVVLTVIRRPRKQLKPRACAVA